MPYLQEIPLYHSLGSDFVLFSLLRLNKVSIPYKFCAVSLSSWFTSSFELVFANITNNEAVQFAYWCIVCLLSSQPTGESELTFTKSLTRNVQNQ